MDVIGGRKMVIYYELIFLINSLIHYVITRLTNKIFFLKINNKRFLISLVLLNLNVYLYVNFKILKYFIKLLGGIILVIISFKTNVKDKILIFFIYLLLNILLKGIVDLINLNILLTLSISLFILSFFGEILIEKRKIRNFYFDVLLDKKFKLKGFLDSGNSVTYNNIPVIFINKDLFDIKDIEITVSSLNSTKKYNATLSNIYIKKDNFNIINKDCFVVYEKIEYEALLNILLF